MLIKNKFLLLMLLVQPFTLVGMNYLLPTLIEDLSFNLIEEMMDIPNYKNLNFVDKILAITKIQSLSPAIQSLSPAIQSLSPAIQSLGLACNVYFLIKEKPIKFKKLKIDLEHSEVQLRIAKALETTQLKQAQFLCDQARDQAELVAKDLEWKKKDRPTSQWQQAAQLNSTNAQYNLNQAQLENEKARCSMNKISNQDAKLKLLESYIRLRENDKDPEHLSLEKIRDPDNLDFNEIIQQLTRDTLNADGKLILEQLKLKLKKDKEKSDPPSHSVQLIKSTDKKDEILKPPQLNSSLPTQPQQDTPGQLGKHLKNREKKGTWLMSPPINEMN